jgi:hypothetical protein
MTPSVIKNVANNGGKEMCSKFLWGKPLDKSLFGRLGRKFEDTQFI